MNTTTIERGTITVQRIIQPTGNRKSHSVKDIDGVMYGVWPDKIALFREGESYDIEYKVNERGFRDITKVQMIARAAPPREDREPAPRSAPSQRVEPPHPATSPNGNRAGEYYRPTSPRDSKNMFVCKIVGDFIRTGRIEVNREHIALVITEVAAAYDMTRGQDQT